MPKTETGSGCKVQKSPSKPVPVSQPVPKNQKPRESVQLIEKKKLALWKTSRFPLLPPCGRGRTGYWELVCILERRMSGKQEAVNPCRNPTVRLNQKTDCWDGNDTEVCPSGKT